MGLAVRGTENESLVWMQAGCAAVKPQIPKCQMELSQVVGVASLSNSTTENKGQTGLGSILSLHLPAS